MHFDFPESFPKLGLYDLEYVHADSGVRMRVMNRRGSTDVQSSSRRIIRSKEATWIRVWYVPSMGSQVLAITYKLPGVSEEDIELDLVKSGLIRG